MLTAASFSGLEPWALTPNGLAVVAEDDRYCEFTADGLAGKDDSHEVLVAWSDVLDVELSIPTHPLWLWWVLAPFFLLIPSALLRESEIYVKVSAKQGTYHLHLGRPSSAPYPVASAAVTNALFEVLSERQELSHLGDPHQGQRLLTVARQCASWSISRSHSRLVAALDRE